MVEDADSKARHALDDAAMIGSYAAIRPDMRTSIDVMITWTAGVTLARYTYTLSQRHKSALESRTLFLATVLTVTLIARGFSWLVPDSVLLSIAAAVPASFLPLAATIFVEGLLRRHVPLFLKVIAVAATGVSLTGAVLGGATPEQGHASLFAQLFLAPYAVTLLGLGLVLVTRNRKTLAANENSLITVCMTATVMSVPLIATDFPYDIGWPFARMGSLAALVLCYTLLRTPSENRSVSRWMRDLTLLIIKALLATLLLRLLLPSIELVFFADFAVLAFALVISYAIWDRLRDLTGPNRITELLRWMATDTPTSLKQFDRQLHHLSLTSDSQITEAEDLAQYDAAAIRDAIDSSRGVLSLAQLRDVRDSSNSSDAVARGADQLADLLERKGVTHVGLLSEKPLKLLLATLPELPGADDSELALAAVIRRGQAAASIEAAANGAGRGHD